MTHAVTDHEPESSTLHYGENNYGRKWVVATEGEKGAGEETPKKKINTEAKKDKRYVTSQRNRWRSFQTF